MKTFLTLFVLFFSSSVLAEGINITCFADWNYDSKKNETTTIVNRVSFTVKQGENINDNWYYFDVNDMCQKYKMSVTDFSLEGVCVKEKATKKITWQLRIDRYTGEMTNLETVNGEQNRLWGGSCKKNEKLF